MREESSKGSEAESNGSWGRELHSGVQAELIEDRKVGPQARSQVRALGLKGMILRAEDYTQGFKASSSRSDSRTAVGGSRRDHRIRALGLKGMTLGAEGYTRGFKASSLRSVRQDCVRESSKGSKAGSNYFGGDVRTRWFQAELAKEHPQSGVPIKEGTGEGEDGPVSKRRSSLISVTRLQLIVAIGSLPLACLNYRLAPDSNHFEFPLPQLLPFLNPSSTSHSSRSSSSSASSSEVQTNRRAKMSQEGKDHRAYSGRRLLIGLLLFLILAGVTALILYLVYRPFKPHFSVSAAAIYDVANASSPASAISTSMQFTLVIRNPNDRAAVYYDRLSAYVSYRNQPITPPAPMPPMFQERDSTLTVSPVLGGGFVPVSGDVAAGLATDEAFGVLGLRLVLLGRLRYKSGPFRSAWYGMYVRCDMLIGFRKGVAGPVPLLGEPECNLDL
ncbi:hypothetical protein Cni_G21920 [Canna indica]|uniref:Late embryogenesis abundant protein LEA-2 subgroup domain-containing protein n=1 Tax=Canna indica TaxID=4628 RepID=A0AAQ3KVV3_9LILI|nr:hypothetical protein Cni_G21920 [Canna indica]